jgi:CDP-glucose 4,6-dehydratase
LENLEVKQMDFKDTFKGRLVLVTGDTGFKGSWLCEWLLSLGANVVGLGLAPNTQPALFNQLNLATRMDHRELDIRDAIAVEKLICEVQPDVVLHLAAQPLVRLSYEIPVETYATNVMGTVHLLNALRSLKKQCAVVCITTDKCYENKEWLHSYREDDPMGGYDPYSSSKGACEIAIESFRKSYFSNPNACGIAVATARAGNVIGGGDWALDRIIPDCVIALKQGTAIPVRNKVATRPWQHVLEPLGGYLLLAAELWRGLSGQAALQANFDYTTLCGAFNFGPSLQSNRTVSELVEEVLKHWQGTWSDQSDPNALHEASLLNLSVDKAHHMLTWSPRWDFAQTIQETIEWYYAAESIDFDAQAYTLSQIQRYQQNL